MQELTLTGATLVDAQREQQVGSRNSNDDPLSQHHHSHSHGHDHQHPMEPNVKLRMSVPELLEQDTAMILHTLTMITRAGKFDLWEEIFTAWKDLYVKKNEGTPLTLPHDANGHTLLHWASKRTDDHRFITFLTQHKPPLIPLTSTTTDGTLMSAMHWACTEPNNLATVKILLQAAPVLLEQVDSTGCTPLLIAAQYNQVDTVAYLVFCQHANVNAVDQNRDSATHWAAYKNSTAVLGLLTYIDSAPLTSPDTYQQTPLHLAALRGHHSACRYILQQLTRRQKLSVLQQKDKNGRTPAELAAHKSHVGVAHYLNEVWEDLTPAQHVAHVLRRHARRFVSLNAWKSWLGLIDPDDSPAVPYYYLISIFVGNILFYMTVLLPLGDTSSGVLWDYMLMHLLEIVLMIASGITLYQTGRVNPGHLQGPTLERHKRWYEEALEQLAQDDESQPKVQLCHSCHVVRPPRSKHDRYTKNCVLLFDHHCPFVGNTVGLYNYGYFYLFLLIVTLYFAGFWILFVVYLVRIPHVPVVTILAGMFLGAHILMSGGMLIYHTQLVVANLTTNEHLNVARYDYLWKSTGKDGSRQFSNPWNRGWYHNIVDRLWPSDSSYQIPETHERLLSGRAV